MRVDFLLTLFFSDKITTVMVTWIQEDHLRGYFLLKLVVSIVLKCHGSAA